MDDEASRERRAALIAQAAACRKWTRMLIEESAELRLEHHQIALRTSFLVRGIRRLRYLRAVEGDAA